MQLRPSRVGKLLAIVFSLAIALLWIRSARTADRFVWKRWELNYVPPNPNLVRLSRLDFTRSESEAFDARIDSGFIVVEYLRLDGDWPAQRQIYLHRGQRCAGTLGWFCEQPRFSTGLPRTSRLNRAGFGYRSYAPYPKALQPQVSFWSASLHLWWLLVASMVMVHARKGWQLRKLLRRKARPRKPKKSKPLPARCPRCGYDLRATPFRCPECGTIFFDVDHARMVMEVAERLRHIECEETDDSPERAYVSC